MLYRLRFGATVWAVQPDAQGSRFLEKREKPEQRGEMRIVDLACDDFSQVQIRGYFRSHLFYLRL